MKRVLALTCMGPQVLEAAIRDTPKPVFNHILGGKATRLHKYEGVHGASAPRGADRTYNIDSLFLSGCLK